jgi:hypothetical protein
MAVKKKDIAILMKFLLPLISLNRNKDHKAAMTPGPVDVRGNTTTIPRFSFAMKKQICATKGQHLYNTIPYLFPTWLLI